MELLYCSALMFIKTSIGCALLRINNNRYIKWAIYIVTFLSVSSGFVPLVVVSSICQPMSGAWTGVGKCRPFSQINTVVVFLTATSISTDVVYSVLPFIILWNLQMKQSKKLIIATLLSLTFMYVQSSPEGRTFAYLSFHHSSSGATIIRAFYIADFSATVNYPCKSKIHLLKQNTKIRLVRIAYPTLYSTIELGTGVIFASIPGVKPIYNLITSRVKKVDSRYDQSDHSKDTDRSGNGKYYTMEALNTAGPPSNDDEENLIHNKSAIKISSKYVV
jgi:hypothetical protein